MKAPWLCFAIGRGRVLPLVFVGAFCFAGQVSALPTLDGDTVNVEFDAGFNDSPVPSDSVLVTADPEITSLDSTAIGDFVLLDFESIDIGGLSLVYNIQGGGADYVGDPGYQQPGFGTDSDPFLAFTDLDISDPDNPLNTHTITGVSITLVGVIGIDASDVLFTGDSVRLSLSGPIGVDAGTDLGSITLNLQIRTTEPPPPSVPVPGSLALLGVGLVALAGRRRNARCSAVRKSMV